MEPNLLMWVGFCLFGAVAGFWGFAYSRTKDYMASSVMWAISSSAFLAGVAVLVVPALVERL